MFASEDQRGQVGESVPLPSFRQESGRSDVYVLIREIPRRPERVPAEEKPTTPFVLTLIAGILILLNGIVIALFGAFIALFILPELAIVLAAVALTFGVVVLVGAFMLWNNPSQHTTWGIVILLFSALSLGIGGGFVIGFILGLLGGILAIEWAPAPMMAPPWMPTVQPPYQPPTSPGQPPAP